MLACSGGERDVQPPLSLREPPTESGDRLPHTYSSSILAASDVTARMRTCVEVFRAPGSKAGSEYNSGTSNTSACVLRMRQDTCRLLQQASTVRLRQEEEM